jgi:hypothetical protein
MALDPRKRQKKLARQRAKRKAKASAQRRTQKSGSSWLNALAGLEFELVSRAPLYKCYVADEIFESDQGIGQVIVSRLSGDQVAAGIFLIDAYCLGVKDAFAFFKPLADFEGQLLASMRQTVRLRRVEPAYAKKLVLDAIAYAHGNGFEPHPDYKLPSKVLRDIDETACATEFTFGKDGKPFFIGGPNDSPARCRQVIDTLHRRFGPDGYHYLVPLSPFEEFFDDDDWEDDEEEWEDEDEDVDEDEDEDDERRRRV